MVLLSEYLVCTASLYFLAVYSALLYDDFLRFNNRTSKGSNHAAPVLLSLFATYAAARMLLEDESPQAVVPAFLAVIIVLLSIMKFGKHHLTEWFARIITTWLVIICLVLFVLFKGFSFLSIVAQTNKLDRQIQWFHIIFVCVSSWRWLLITLVMAFPVYTHHYGLLLTALKIVIMWVMYVGSGTSVTSSPWGSLDELLLERNAFLSLIISLVTFVVIMEQVEARLRAQEQQRIEQSGRDMEPCDWDEFKKAMRSFFQKATQDKFEEAFFELFPYLEESASEQVLSGDVATGIEQLSDNL